MKHEFYRRKEGFFFLCKIKRKRKIKPVQNCFLCLFCNNTKKSLSTTLKNKTKKEK